jgi:hypothetical protein
MGGLVSNSGDYESNYNILNKPNCLYASPVLDYSGYADFNKIGCKEGFQLIRWVSQYHGFW